LVPGSFQPIKVIGDHFYDEVDGPRVKVAGSSENVAQLSRVCAAWPRGADGLLAVARQPSEKGHRVDLTSPAPYLEVEVWGGHVPRCTAQAQDSPAADVLALANVDFREVRVDG
jgi:hypothetical protein